MSERDLPLSTRRGERGKETRSRLLLFNQESMALARLQPLVLKPRQATSSAQERWVAVLFAVALFSALVWVAYMLLGNPFGAWDWESFAKAFRVFLAKAPTDSLIEVVALIIVTGLHLWYLRRASRNERL